MEYSLKITGTAALAEQLDASKDVTIKAELSIYQVSKTDLQDGNFEICYKTKIISAVECEQSERKIKGIDKTKASQRLRWRLMAKAGELGIDPEQYYQDCMNKIISEV